MALTSIYSLSQVMWSQETTSLGLMHSLVLCKILGKPTPTKKVSVGQADSLEFRSEADRIQTPILPLVRHMRCDLSVKALCI